MNRMQANLVLLLAAAIWGGGFVAQATAMETLGPFWFIGLRFAIATLCVLPFAINEGRRASQPLSERHVKGFLMIGLALFLGAATQQVGLRYTTVTNSSFLTGLYVVFVPAISVIFLRKAPHWIIWPAALMSLAGIFLLSGGALDRLTIGDGLTIICAFFWAIQLTLVGLFVGDSGRPLLLSTVQFAVCAIGGMLVGAATEHLTLDAISGALTEILYVGIFSSGFAFVLQVIGQRYTTAPQAAIFLSAEALFGGLFGALLLNETLTTAGYVGCGIIFVAMIMVETVPELLKRKSISAR
ncbi:DMT family transporter [Gellertiella hungarica]|uniref:Drug/metabolite transporter (DMT)-like permease n=1 Tax=Gellertiella hungarica TaxID=1572859 RepID=A0A7W6J3Y5_9HYPH|nr:DMT family transporter [Gellertiella hungarica]MBB4063423.1 drug/metabolite transporter (DMT)-like permease [Gellertiella hungarica]